MGSLSLLQGIFPTQGSSPGLPHCRQILYQLGHKGSPRILEWVAHSFSSGSSCCRNRTGVSCIAGGFFTNWAIKGSTVHRKSPFKMTPAPWFSGQHSFNRQDMEFTKRSSGRKVKTCWYIYNWNTTQPQTEWNKDAVSSVGVLKNNHAKWENSETERQISWDITYRCSL